MENEPYVKIPRRFLTDEMLHNPETLQVYLYLVREAAIEPHEVTARGEKIHLNAGEVVSGRTFIAKATGLTERKVRTSISTIKTASLMTSKTTSRYSIFSLTNQWFTSTSIDRAASKTTSKVTSTLASKTTTDKRILKNINIPPYTPPSEEEGDGTVKSENPSGEQGSLLAPTTGPKTQGKRHGRKLTNADILAMPYSEDFEKVYAAYPKHQGKGQAWITWNKLSQAMGENFPTVEALVEAISWKKVSDGWVKDGGQFIPLLSSWLNKSGWEDEDAHRQPSEDRNQVLTPRQTMERDKFIAEWQPQINQAIAAGDFVKANRLQDGLNFMLEELGVAL